MVFIFITMRREVIKMNKTFEDWLVEGYKVILIWSLLIISPALAIDAIINGFSITTGIAFTYIAINLLIAITSYFEARKRGDENEAG